LILDGRSANCPACAHRQALDRIAQALQREGLPAPDAVGHRVVHGGARFKAPAVIDEAVLAAIKATIPLAPLHNPPNLEGINLARALWPDAVQVAVFDTAFHQTMPPRAFRYAVPQDWYRDFGIRRYGFHGLSHAYVAKRAAAFLGKPLASLKLISFHLGNGASACAIAGGQSQDTSMGLTPLEGLVMGTRPGDLDPGALLHLLQQRQIRPAELKERLNFSCGLKALCGMSDMRQIHADIARGSKDAELALEIFCYRVKKYLGAYLAVLGGADAIVFTGGIGENDFEVRARSLAGLERFGIAIDEAKNRCVLEDVMEIQSERASIKVLVIATDEEREIAENVLNLLEVPP
ncbi:MAG: acetate/propionate family kinase, partial [Methylohalobius sp.]